MDVNSDTTPNEVSDSSPEDLKFLFSFTASEALKVKTSDLPVSDEKSNRYLAS